MTKAPAQYPKWLANFVSTYQQLSTDNLALLTALYHEQIHFQDPLHQLNGLAQLTSYFDGLYQNVIQCQFEIHEVIYNEQQASVYWTMTFEHTKLAKGKSIEVAGNSMIKGQNDKVIYHRDYFDLGAMLYEQLPVLGKLIKLLKRKAADA